MSAPMLGLVAAGILLFLAAPMIARAIVGREADPVGATRIIQVVAVILMISALLIRPYSDETSAFPPAPDLRGDSAR